MAEPFLAEGMLVRIFTEQELVEKYPLYAHRIKEKDYFYISQLDTPTLTTRDMYKYLGMVVTITGSIGRDNKGAFFAVEENPYLWDLTLCEPIDSIPIEMLPYKNRKEN